MSSSSNGQEWRMMGSLSCPAWPDPFSANEEVKHQGAPGWGWHLSCQSQDKTPFL